MDGTRTTQFPARHVQDIMCSFLLLILDSNQKIILGITNVEGRSFFLVSSRKMWTSSLLVCTGQQGSWLKVCGSLRQGWEMFRASMSLKNSHVFSKIIIFDDQKSELCVIVVYFMYVCMINLYMQDKLHYTVF